MKPEILENELIPISEIKPDPKNERLHPDENIEMLKKGLIEFGQRKPVVINKKNELKAGHGIFTAAKALGWSHINCVRSNLNKTKEKAFRIFDNKSAELSKWDCERLGQTLYELDNEGYAIFDYGFDESEVSVPKTDSEKEAIEDNVPDTKENEFGVEKGDIWVLGNHRLMCGDSTSEEDVTKLMDGNKADMVFTDPPYGVSIKGKYTGTIKNDDLREGELEVFLKKNALILNNFNKGSAYICFEVLNSVEFFNAYSKPDEMICWNKDSTSFYSKNKWNRKFELIMFFKGGRDPNVEAGTNVWDFPKSSSFNSRDENGKRFNEKGNYCVAHPTTKPVSLPSKAIEASSDKDNIILDTFTGSGSTLIACEKTNRTCFGMELDPHYCSIIIKRWEDYTNKKAMKIN